MKISSNIEWARNNDLKVRGLGWNLIVVWECECSTQPRLQSVTNRILKRLSKRV
jgi:G:T-mismatch repair DNA endonuclease (very short patch repair protein)